MLLPELSGHRSGALGFPCPPETSFDAAGHLLEPPGHAPKHRKQPDLTGKCLNQKVVIQAGGGDRTD